MKTSKYAYIACGLLAVTPLVILDLKAAENASSESANLKNPTPQECGVSLTIQDLCVNDDHDHTGDAAEPDGLEDLEISPSPGDDDLAPLIITGTADKFAGTLTLNVLSGLEHLKSPSGEVFLYEDNEKNKAIDTTSWPIPAGTTLIKIFYIEGITHSTLKEIKMQAIFEAPGGDIDGVTYKECKVTTAVQEATVYDVEIYDEKTGSEVADNYDAKVAVRGRYKAEVKPTPPGSISYKWKVNGNEPALKEDGLKTYEHDIIGEHKPIALKSADHTEQSFHIYWCREHDPILKVEVDFGLKCAEEITLKATTHEDANREVYATLIEQAIADDEHKDVNPNGAGNVYRLNVDHLTHHASNDGGITNPVFLRQADKFKGDVFLQWHADVITSHLAWRETFNLGPFKETPGNFLPRPTYTTIAGGDNISHHYGYVRLGECKDLNELGHLIAAGWHNSGHLDQVVKYGREDMETPETSMRTPDDIFWRWHSLIDEVRTDFIANGPDQAEFDSSTPASDGEWATKTITLRFKQPVSQRELETAKLDSTNPYVWNSAGLHISDFTFNSKSITQDAILDRGTSRKEYKLIFHAAPNLNDTNTLEFKGTRAIKPFTINFKKP